MTSPNHSDYVGSRLTVVTKAGIRYEGNLYDLNQKNSTVSLSEVRVLGTEGRASEVGKPEIPPSSNVFKFLVFSGNDIQDLVVLSSPQDVHHDPAVIAVNVQPEQVNSGIKGGSYSGSYMDQRRRQAGGHYGRSPRRNAGGVLKEAINAEKLRAEYERAYDFDEANKNVDKAKIAEEVARSLDGIKVASGYSKERGFYDDISNGMQWSRPSHYNGNNNAPNQFNQQGPLSIRHL